MALDVSLGTISEAEARRLGATDRHTPGSTEPWISNLVCAFVRAIGAWRVLETGGFVGDTTIAIADTLCDMGGGQIWTCEIDPERRERLMFRLDLMGYEKADWLVLGDAMHTIHELRDSYLDLAFVDDDHTKDHVREEIRALWPKVRPGGLILLHDVFGVCDLQEVVAESGGYSIDIPRLGPAGGLGVIQVRE